MNYKCGKCGMVTDQPAGLEGHECRPTESVCTETTPKIEIDAHALRFTFVNGDGANLFWNDLFAPVPHNDKFQHKVMLLLKRLYDECVINNIVPDYDEAKLQPCPKSCL